MSGEGKIESYIAQSQAEGSLDSRGQFTLNRAMASGKLGSKLMRSSGDYTGRLIQLANSLQVTGPVNFRLGRSRMQTRFEFIPDTTVTPEEVAQAIETGQFTSRAVEHLATAMVAAPGECVSWEVDGVGEVTYQDGRLTLRQEEAPVHGKWTGLFTVRRKSRFLASLFSKQPGLEHAAIYSRGRYSARSLRVDGREVESGWPRDARPYKSGFWTDYIVPGHYYLMEGYLGKTPELPPFKFPLSLKWAEEEAPGVYRDRRFLLSRDGSFYVRKNEEKGRPPFYAREELPMSSLYTAFLDCTPEDEFGAAFALPLCLTGPSQVTFLFDGVCAQPKGVDLGVPGLLCVASGGGLLTDLSGMAPVEDEAYQRAVESLRLAARRFFGEVIRYKNSYLNCLLYNPLTVDIIEYNKDCRADLYAKDVRTGILTRLERIERELG